MPKHTTPQPLDLGKALRVERDKANNERKAEIDEALAALPELRYHPLSGFGSADYIEAYAPKIEAAGVFDSLKYGAAELRLSKDTVDLAGFAALASAFIRALSQAAGIEDGEGVPAPGSAGKIRALVTDHCQHFKVQVRSESGEGWIDLADADTIDTYLDFGDMLDVVFALAGGVLRPLWSRLRSRGAGMLSESPKPSTSATQAS